MEKAKNHKSGHRFWKVYGVVFGVLVVLVLTFLAVFFDIIRVYEQAQPATAASAFAASVDEATLTEAIRAAIAEYGSPYEDEEAVLPAIEEAIGEKPAVYTKDYTAYTSERPVFIVSCGDVPVYRITLTAGEALRYGFSSFETAAVEFVLPYDEFVSNTAVAYVPDGATLYLNGTEVTAEPDGTVPYRYSGKWESEITLKSERYEFKLVCDAAFTCIRDGVTCEMRTEEDGIYFVYPDEQLLTYTVTAPDNVLVRVNGVLLGEDEITESGLQYETHRVEALREDLPTMTVYTVGGLTVQPEVTAETYYGIRLPVALAGNAFSVDYPEGAYQTCTICVPSGSVVSVNGVVLEQADITATEAKSTELFSYASAAPSYDIYTLTGLFLPPASVEVTYGGTALPLTSAADGGTHSYDGTYPRVEADATRAVALDYLYAYFHYTSNGHVNTDQNLAGVLAYIPYECELYQTMVQSKVGFSWTTPVTDMTYNTLTVTDVLAYPEGLYLCMVDFDISQTFYGWVHREYKGKMKLIVTAEGKVVGMEINADKSG